MVGQRVDDDLVICGSSVGVQVEMGKLFLRNRNDVMVENRCLTKRAFRSNSKVATVVLHNENNFLNRGDILHTALRMLSKR